MIYFLYIFGSSTTQDRSTTHPKFDPIGVRTHDLQIMTVQFMSQTHSSMSYYYCYCTIDNCVCYLSFQVDDVPSNVMLSKWLPQNDLLGHKKTRLFIAHGGNNGQMEGLYHGLPMIVMPFGGDQMYSAWRAC